MAENLDLFAPEPEPRPAPETGTADEAGAAAGEGPTVKSAPVRASAAPAPAGPAPTPAAAPPVAPVHASAAGPGHAPERAPRRWTGEQARALAADHDVLLVASAGTGKTTTVVGKILWLLGLDAGVDGDTGRAVPPCADPCRLPQIAAITFTEKAAYDLKRKLREELDARAPELRWEVDRASIGTIHSFCGALLREHALRLGIDPSFRVLDEREARAEQDRIIRGTLMGLLEAGDEGAAELYRSVGKLQGASEYARGLVDLVREAVRDLRWHRHRYDAWRDGGELSPERLRSLAPEWTPQDDALAARCATLCRLAETALEAWRDWLAEENVRDFDSLILDTRDLLTGPQAGAALEGVRRRYRILIIDEFQDTDHAQRDIAWAIAGLGDPDRAAGPQLFLVGDPKQSIYRFRGADIAVWNEVAASLSARAGPLPLSRNFRSDPAVVGFVNLSAATAMNGTASPLAQEAPGSVVRYSELRPARPRSGVGGVEWLAAAPGSSSGERRESEAHHLATRIRALVDGAEPVVDEATGEPRPCRYSDIAVLFRARTGLGTYEDALRRFGVPFTQAGASGLLQRQEVLDLATALRVLHDPDDDLRAFAFLRSPFVGLRDEVLARMRMEGRPWESYLKQAAAWLERGEAFPAPEHPIIADVEREALRRGLEALEEAWELAHRLPLDEALRHLVERTGYRNHLLLLDGHREALANLHAFLALLEEHRDRPLGTFLEIWDRWDHRDPGIPRAPLHSADDDVVTLSTIHTAKGLEWPVVFLVDVADDPRDNLPGDFWSDPELGPILCPKKDERGAWAERLHRRRTLEEQAEEARLLYVAATRARDRLIIVAPEAPRKGYAAWLWEGRSLDVTGAGPGNLVIRRDPAAVPPPPHPEPVALAWLDLVAESRLPESARPLSEPPLGFITSATERMMREKHPAEWEQRYRHGITPVWQFAPARGGAAGAGGEAAVPATLRGTIIHGVLERIREERELSRILEETLGELDAPELETVRAAGDAYRDALEEEIRRVVRDERWRWYVEGRCWRELDFLHLAGPRDWRLGSFDLFRLLTTDEERRRAGRADAAALIVDFKTHVVDAAEAARVARDYAIQAEVYRLAAGVLGPAAVRFHFTAPNAVVEG